MVSGCEEHRHVLSRRGTVLHRVRCRDGSDQFHNFSHNFYSNIFQCFTHCVKSQAAAPMPSQLRTFTLSDWDSLEPRVSDVGALPAHAVLPQSTAIASTKLDHAKPCQEKASSRTFPFHCISLNLSLTFPYSPSRLCFQMFPIIEILTSSLASWHLDRRSIVV